MSLSDIEMLDRFGLAKLRTISQGLTPEEFALKFAREGTIPTSLATEQVKCFNKISKKLPIFKDQELFVVATSFEQCSSQATAQYKASLFSGSAFIDLTGGLGVDTIFLSKHFETSVYCEQNSHLCDLFKYNTTKLKLNIEIHNSDGVKIVEGFRDDSFDLLYVDPSRRVSGRRVTALAHCEPDVTNLMSLFLSKASRVCIKAAPAYDITMAVKEIDNLKEIIVVSLDGECREVLLICDRKNENKITLRSVLLKRDGAVADEYLSVIGEAESPRKTEMPLNYFYVPDPAIFKTGHSDKVAEKFGLYFLNRTVDYLTGDELCLNFPGKIYKVVSVIGWGRKDVIGYLKSRGIKKASISRREFPLDPPGIRKMLKIDDGGDDYLFFTKDHKGKKICIHCIKK